MIELKVDEYCGDCPEFEPFTEKQMYYSDNGIVFSDTRVMCKDREKCRYIKQFISKSKKDGNE